MIANRVWGCAFFCIASRGPEVSLVFCKELSPFGFHELVNSFFTDSIIPDGVVIECRTKDREFKERGVKEEGFDESTNSLAEYLVEEYDGAFSRAKMKVSF